jgi:uncharacterized FAD-dependent dehydrogenase
MPLIVDIVIPAEEINDSTFIKKTVLQKHPLQDVTDFRIIKRSIDARQSQIKFQLRLEVYTGNEIVPESSTQYMTKSDVSSASHQVVIIGAGPAGLFAALRCIELGMKPIVIERGKSVRDRRRDLAAINKQHLVNPESNYCFGEGGAGTYSDGKLYTRSTKRGDVQAVLEKFVHFGAPQDIMVDAHPHIGTNKLPSIIEGMRQFILDCGGEVHFNSKMVDFNLHGNKIESIICSNEIEYKGDHFILATGHSARDIYQLLHDKGILIEFKSFALGVRAEHQQAIIDSTQYRCEERPEYLPPASYSLVEQVDGRGVYSFCMCPGGIIAPCATADDEVVTNGWSPSKRNNPWANSGIVVPICWEDLEEFHQYGPLAGMMFQKHVEHQCWLAGGKMQTAPAQRMIDFVEKKKSKDLPEVSYQPGIISVMLDDVLPAFVAERLRKGFVMFGKKLKGYYTNEAVLVATESRTSSPVRIPRDKDALHHPEIINLYPSAEGAGYAGGIASAAIDGQKVAEAIHLSVQ